MKKLTIILLVGLAVPCLLAVEAYKGGALYDTAPPGGGDFVERRGDSMYGPLDMQGSNIQNVYGLWILDNIYLPNDVLKNAYYDTGSVDTRVILDGTIQDADIGEVTLGGLFDVRDYNHPFWGPVNGDTIVWNAGAGEWRYTKITTAPDFLPAGNWKDVLTKDNSGNPYSYEAVTRESISLFDWGNVASGVLGEGFLLFWNENVAPNQQNFVPKYIGDVVAWNMLSDTAPMGTAGTGQIPVFGADDKWYPQDPPPSVAGDPQPMTWLTDTPPSPSSSPKTLLAYEPGDQWRYRALNYWGIDELGDVFAPTPQVDQVLTWNGNQWVALPAQSGAQSVFDLTDVTEKAWNTSEINFLIAPVGTEEFENAAMSLGMAYDVDYTGLNADKILKFSTTTFKWEVADDQDTIYDLDVDKPGTNTDDILVWNGSTWTTGPQPAPDLSDVWLYGTNDTLPAWIQAEDYGLKASGTAADRSQFGFTAGNEPDMRGVGGSTYLRADGSRWVVSPHVLINGYAEFASGNQTPPTSGYGRVFSKAVNGESELHWASDDFNEVQVTRDGSVNSINLINSILPDNLGNFKILAGTNVTVEDGPGASEITINSASPSATLAFNDLTDVNTTGVTDGQVVKWNSTAGLWLPAADNDTGATPGTNKLGELVDVLESGPVIGQYLRVNTASDADPNHWINAAIQVGDLPLHAVEHEPGGGDVIDLGQWNVESLGDVNGSANAGDFLIRAGGQWDPQPALLNSLSNVNTAPVDGEALVWDNTAGEWIADTPGGKLIGLDDTAGSYPATLENQVVMYTSATDPTRFTYVPMELQLNSDVVYGELAAIANNDILVWTNGTHFANVPVDYMFGEGPFVRDDVDDNKAGTLTMTDGWIDFLTTDTGISFGGGNEVTIGYELDGFGNTFQLNNPGSGKDLWMRDWDNVWAGAEIDNGFHVGNWELRNNTTNEPRINMWAANTTYNTDPVFQMEGTALWTGTDSKTMTMHMDADGMVVASGATGTKPIFKFDGWNELWVTTNPTMKISGDTITGGGGPLTFTNWSDVDFGADTIDWTSIDKTGSSIGDLDDVVITAPVTNAVLAYNGTSWADLDPTFLALLLDQWVDEAGDTMTGDLLLTSNADLQLERGSSVIRFDSPVAAVDPVIYLNTNDNLIFDMNDGGTTWFYDSSQLSIYQTDSTSNHVQFNVSSLAESWYEGATLKYQQNVDSTATRLIGFDTSTTLEVGGTFVNVTLPNNAVNVNEIADDVPISKLIDVDTTGASADDWLQYDGTTWRPQTFVSEVIPPGSSTSHILRWNGTSWVATPFSTFLIADLGDVSSTTPATGQVLKWDGVLGEWVPAEDNASTITNIADLGDVTITAPQQRDLFSWRGTEWVNVPPDDYLLSEWSEVQYNTGGMVANDSVLVWNGATFVDGLLSTLVPTLVSGTYVEVAGDNMTGNLVMVNNAEVRVEGGGALRLEDDAPLLLQTDTSFPHLYFDSTQDRTELHQMSKALQVLDSGPVFMDTNLFTLSDPNGSFQVQTATSLFQLSDAIRAVTHDLTAVSYAIFPGSALPLDLSGFSDLFLPALSVNVGELANDIPINKLVDVDYTAANNNDVLTYNGAYWEPGPQQGGWTPPVGTVDDQILVWSTGASDWVTADFANRYPLRDMSDVAATTPNTNDVLTWTGTEWGPKATGATIQNLDDLFDVDTASVTNKDFLSYNGAYWEPISMADYDVGELGDVDTSSTPVTNDSFLLWDGANYANSSLSTAMAALGDTRWVNRTGDTVLGPLNFSLGAHITLEDDARINFSAASTTPYQYYNNSQSRLYTQLEQKPWYIMDAQSVFIEDASTFRVYDTARSNIEFSTTFATFVMQNYITTGNVTHDLNAADYTISTTASPMDLIFTGWDNVNFPADTIDHASLKDYLLEDISDVNITGRVDGSVLSWDLASSEWIMSPVVIAPGVNWYDWTTGTGSDVGVVFESDSRVWGGTTWESRPPDMRDLYDVFYYQENEPNASATLEVNIGDVLSWTYNSKLQRDSWNPIAVTGNLPVLPISAHGAMLFWDGAIQAWSDTAREAGLFRVELMHWDMATNFGTDVIFAPPLSAGLPSNQPGNVVFGMGWGADPDPSLLLGAVDILQGTPLNFVEPLTVNTSAILLDTHQNWGTARTAVSSQHSLVALTSLQARDYPGYEFIGVDGDWNGNWEDYTIDLSYMWEAGLPSSTSWAFRNPGDTSGTSPDEGWNLVQGTLNLKYAERHIQQGSADAWRWGTTNIAGTDDTIANVMDFTGLDTVYAPLVNINTVADPVMSWRQYDTATPGATLEGGIRWALDPDFEYAHDPGVAVGRLYTDSHTNVGLLDLTGFSEIAMHEFYQSDGQSGGGDQKFQQSYGYQNSFQYNSFLVTRHSSNNNTQNWVMWDVWQVGDDIDKYEPDSQAWTAGVRGDGRVLVNPDDWNVDDASRDATLNASANNELTTKWYVDNNTSVGAHSYAFETVTADTTSPRMDLTTSGNNGSTIEVTIRGGANNRDYTYVKFVCQYYVDGIGVWRADIIASHSKGNAFSNNIRCHFNSGAYTLSMLMLRDDATTVKAVGYRTDTTGGALGFSKLGTPNDGTGNNYGNISF